mmetsp:Transcript_29206/g.65953  ORF Transcript_29206/g.65953 Transcript_29206/m.65953 type:complete len:835 (-) Transcript_29206:198-2702(-)
MSLCLAQGISCQWEAWGEWSRSGCWIGEAEDLVVLCAEPHPRRRNIRTSPSRHLVVGNPLRRRLYRNMNMTMRRLVWIAALLAASSASDTDARVLKGVSSARDGGDRSLKSRRNNKNGDNRRNKKGNFFSGIRQKKKGKKRGKRGKKRGSTCGGSQYSTCLNRSTNAISNVPPPVSGRERLISGTIVADMMSDDTSVNCLSSSKLEKTTLTYLADNIGGGGNTASFEPVCVRVKRGARAQENVPDRGRTTRTNAVEMIVTYVDRSGRSRSLDGEWTEEQDYTSPDEERELRRVGGCKAIDRALCCSQAVINGAMGKHCKQKGCGSRNCGAGRRRDIFQRSLGDEAENEDSRRLQRNSQSLANADYNDSVRRYTPFNPEATVAHLDTKSLIDVARCGASRLSIDKFDVPTLTCEDFYKSDCVHNDDLTPELTEENGGCLLPLPTNAPTYSPTYLPTANPTAFPTKTPTELPTNIPTDIPTTSEPTGLPTFEPSVVSSCNTAIVMDEGSCEEDPIVIKPCRGDNSVKTTEVSVIEISERRNWFVSEVTVQGEGYLCEVSKDGFSILVTPRLILGSGRIQASPTLSPSYFPTESPTSMEPTEAPTSMEPTTFVPTVYPTVEPTGIPTSDPTIDPTRYPTMLPTIDPTLSPSISPTFSPTLHPTSSPTLNPTLSPTLSPSLSPTTSPTVSPTEVPSEVPSEAPSARSASRRERRTEKNTHKVENSFFDDIVSAHDERKLQGVKSSCGTFVGDDVCVYAIVNKRRGAASIGRGGQPSRRMPARVKRLYLVDPEVKGRGAECNPRGLPTCRTGFSCVPMKPCDADSQQYRCKDGQKDPCD